MFKAMILLKRKEGLSFDDFKNWWLNDHAVLVRQLPGLRRCVVNLAEGDGAGLYDGCSELWFDSEADFTAAYATEIGQSVAADSLSKVTKRDRLLVREEEVFPG